MSMYDDDFRVPEESRKGMDLERIEKAVREILIAVGEDPDREGLLETPNRVARMYGEVFSGLHRDIRFALCRGRQAASTPLRRVRAVLIPIRTGRKADVPA